MAAPTPTDRIESTDRSDKTYECSIKYVLRMLDRIKSTDVSSDKAYRCWIKGNLRIQFTMNSSIAIRDESEQFRVKYSKLKRKLKNLVYENESYRDELLRCQRKLLKLNRDKCFLLDRLLQYETAVNSSDSETTEGSDTEADHRHGRRKPDAGSERSPAKRKKQIMKGKNQASRSQVARSFADNGHMTPEEVERHLESRAAVKNPDMVAERAPPTVPRQLFSTEDGEWDGRESLDTASNVDEEGLVIDFPE